MAVAMTATVMALNINFSPKNNILSNISLSNMGTLTIGELENRSCYLYSGSSVILLLLMEKNRPTIILNIKNLFDNQNR